MHILLPAIVTFLMQTWLQRHNFTGMMFVHHEIPIQSIAWHHVRSKLKKSQNILVLNNAIVWIGHTSIYQYIHSILVCNVQLEVRYHTASSYGITFDPPCAADGSQHDACGLQPCEHASFLQWPQLTDSDHPDVACHVQSRVRTTDHLVGNG